MMKVIMKEIAGEEIRPPARATGREAGIGKIRRVSKFWGVSFK